MEKKQHKSDKHRRHHHHQQQSSSSSSSSGGSGGSSPAHGAPKAANAFANDGSFMELFKKKMEDEERRKREGEEEEEKTKSSAAAPDKKPLSVSSFVGKRRGGARLALKTGVVAKKQKPDSEVEAGKGDAWMKYMAEVKKYKAHQCGDDDKTRPLVK